MNTQKKNDELACLQSVIEAGKKLRGEAKHIVELLDSEDVPRTDNESPDFVRVTPATSKNKKDIFIGIEHFSVDHNSLKKKNGDVASRGVVQDKKNKEIVLKWQKRVKESNELPEGAKKDLLDRIAEGLEHVEAQTYHSLLGSFKHSLEKHLGKVEKYKENIGKLGTENSEIKIAFLIEIYTELPFAQLFLNDKNGTHINTSGLMPMFGDVVRLLQDIEGVDYVVLCLKTRVNTGGMKVIAFRKGNIQKQCKMQKVEIYEYAGDDCLLTDFQAKAKNVKVVPSYTQKDDSISITMDYTADEITKEQRIEFVWYAASIAHYAIRNNINFATTYLVQCFMELYGDSVTEWRKVGGHTETWKVKPILNHKINGEEIKARKRAFEEKWPKPDNEEIKITKK